MAVVLHILTAGSTISAIRALLANEAVPLDIFVDVLNALARLPPNAQVITHLLMLDHTQGEIAERLGVSQSTVSRAIQQHMQTMASGIKIVKRK